MKKLTYLLFCTAIVIVTACSDNDPKSAMKKNELGLIVPQINASENVLLLKDGTLTRPVSGIDDFDSRSVGSKLLINYRTVGVENGITNIAVTHFAEANDSTFTPDPDPIDTEDFVYGADFSGRYYVANEDSSVLYTGHVSFSFGSKQSGNSSYTYTFTPDDGEPFSGEGEFEISGGNLIFENNDNEDIVVPLGEFTPSTGIGTLYFWPVEFNGLYFAYALSVDE